MWKAVLRTLYRMMGVRGQPIKECDVDAVARNLSTQSGHIHYLYTEDAHHIIHLNNETKVGIKSIRTLIDKMTQEGLTHAICVFTQPPTPFARRFLVNLHHESDLHIEYFFSYELIFDITQHKLMPKHGRLTEAEKQALIHRYGKEEHCYPKIQLNDPMARYLGLKIGDMIRVERNIPHLGRSVTYRIACASVTK